MDLLGALFSPPGVVNAAQAVVVSTITACASILITTTTLFIHRKAGQKMTAAATPKDRSVADRLDSDVLVVTLPSHIEQYLLDLLARYNFDLAVNSSKTGARIMTIIPPSAYEALYDSALLARDPGRFGFLIVDSPDLEDDVGAPLEDVLR